MSEDRFVIVMRLGAVELPRWPSRWGADIDDNGVRSPRFFPSPIKLRYENGLSWPDDFPDGTFPPTPKRCERRGGLGGSGCLAFRSRPAIIVRRFEI